MTGFAVPWWGWLVTIVLVILSIALAAGIVNLVLWAARALWGGKEKSSRPDEVYRGR